MGLFIHNTIENVDGSTVLVALVAALLFLGWWRLPLERLTTSLLLLLGLVHLVGGAIVSLIPFSFLPFVPAQTITHYLTHFIYGLSQIPLVTAMARQLRKSKYPRPLIIEPIKQIPNNQHWKS